MIALGHIVILIIELYSLFDFSKRLKLNFCLQKGKKAHRFTMNERPKFNSAGYNRDWEVGSFEPVSNQLEHPSNRIAMP